MRRGKIGTRIAAGALALSLTLSQTLSQTLNRLKNIDLMRREEK